MIGEEKPGGRRGRKTKEQEARDYLGGLGVNLDRVLAEAGIDDDSPMPGTFAEMRDEFARILWAKRNTLGATAFSQSLSTLARLAAAAKEEDPEGEAEPLIADVIAGIAPLSAARRREILKGALVRLDEERARIVEALGA